MKAWVQTTQSSCNPAVDETTALRTASCQVTVTNRGKGALTLDVAVQTNSASPKNPADYFDGSPTDLHPKSDPKHGVPDYSENLYITDSNNNHFGFGLVTCSVPVPKTTSTCSSSLTTPSAITLQPGNSDTFTVTVHLNHGGHNGGTLTVDLKANVGAGTLGALLTTFGLS